jgi:surface polysaccharide O-acyltransferase-like enzyme
MSRDTGHLFIDNIRHCSMMGVVLLHCYPTSIAVSHGPGFLIQILFQSAKFATIAFFVVAGFLLGERIGRRDRRQYLWRRVSKLGAPWLAWFGIYCGTLAFGHWLCHRPLDHFPTFTETVVGPLFASAFWFVPNLIFALSILLALSQQIDNWRWGAILFGPALFYSLNVYGHWVDIRHTTAFTGFLGYLWLGAWAARNWDKAEQAISAVSARALFALLFVLLFLGVYETRLLIFLHSSEPQNTLRITNQLFSINAVLLLARVRIRLWPGFISVRDHTFGIYLAHSPISVVAGFLLTHVAPLARLMGDHSAAGLICLWVARFACTYGLSVLLTLLIAHSPRVSWMVGIPSRAQMPVSVSMAHAEH